MEGYHGLVLVLDVALEHDMLIIPGTPQMHINEGGAFDQTTPSFTNTSDFQQGFDGQSREDLHHHFLGQVHPTILVEAFSYTMYISLLIVVFLKGKQRG